MKHLTLIIGLLVTINAWTAEKIKFNYVNEEITHIVEAYAKATGQKFVIDSTVRGKVSILNQTDLTNEEAFNQLSEALSVNGFAIVNQGDFYTIRNARSVQRDNVPVSAEVPTAKPQRMATWIVTLKNISAYEVMKDVRMMTSSFGEMTTSQTTNQLIITDWTSNIQRVAELVKQIDKPVDANTAKIVAAQKKQWADDQKNRPKNSGDLKPPPPAAKE